MSQCKESFHTLIFFNFHKNLSSEKTLDGQTGPKGRGRVESVQEMGEKVETVLEMCDGTQVYSSFHTDVT
jgi:hypothetical protein